MTNIFPRNEIPDLIDNTKIIEMQITDWFIPESDKVKDRPENPDDYSILIYGTNNENITICVKIIEYEPYFYIKPHDSWNALTDKEFKKKVDELNVKLLEDKYEVNWKDPETKRNTKYNKKIISKEYEKHFNRLSIVKKKDFWGFTNNKIFRFIKISTKSLKLYNNLKYYFMSLKDEYKLYESNIDPFLKYIHIQNIKPCGWIKIAKYEIDTECNTRCNYNLISKWNDIESININQIAPLLIASFDIECNSSHGDFPVANKDYKKLAQDLCLIAKSGYDYGKQYLESWLLNAYFNDIEIDTNCKINKLYPKNKINIDKVKQQIDKIINEVYLVLEKISIINENDDDNDNEDDDENVNKMTVKEYNEYEDKLTSILNRVLPKLEGDKVIQIGTTVHKYGSDEIIYKHIITLDTCDDIENTEVISCKTEKELLIQWKNLMIKLNPDIIIGYNICGFDMEYIWLRVIENDIKDNFSLGLGRSLNRNVTLTEQKLASSAMGENILKSFDMDGTVIIDLFKIMQREQKLDSYKLDNVASIFIGEHKDDIKPHEIFEKFKGNSLDRCIIAKYCIQDCVLINKLLHKLKIIENNIGMGNVCLVPLNYLFKRGQGIKIFSLINNECMKKGFLIPVIKNFTNDEYEEDGYEGAIVLEPKEGIYLNEPIVVFDYGSLYPSSMICRNLSHDTYVNNKKYMIEDPNIEYVKVSYDLYEGVGDKKIKTDVKECIFAQYKDGRKGIIPEILNMLLEERKNTRKKIEYKTITDIHNNIYIGFPEEKENNIILSNIDTKENFIINKSDIKENKDTYNKFEKDVFDALQAAYKITANSLYGQIGARTSPIYLKDIAACTTSTGREMIMIAKEFVETNYGADVIYGDSVMPYTPITYKLNNNEIIITTFDKLDGMWIPYNQFKLNEADRTNKEQIIPINMKVWTHKGWSDIKRIIRHKTIKKIYRILTNSGLIDVTEDHSLLTKKVEIIKPNDCIPGLELLHSKPNIDVNFDYKLNDNFDKYCYLAFSGDEQLKAQCTFIKLQSLGYNVTLNNYNHNNYLIIYTKDKQSINTNIIKKIDVLYEKYDGYVYDIETTEGVFHSGVGNLILKNTDSIFCKFPIRDINGCEINGKEALSYAIEIGKKVEKNIVPILPSPQKLNYEKCLYPFILFSKKRYVGNLYENDVNKFKQKSMGIVLKRRDNANIVKKIYGGIIDIILNKQDLNLSVFFLKDELNDLVNGKTDIKDLILSKTLKSSYKDPTKIAHKVLADRIAARDAGNKPAINDRMQYIYIKVANAKLQGDKIETPDYIKENKLTPDYLHYITNQIMKPVLQLYALCLTELPNYDKPPDYWETLEEELMQKPLYNDDKKRKNRLNNLKLNYVQELLFDEFISMLKEPKIKKERSKTVKSEIKTEIKSEIKPEIKSEIKSEIKTEKEIVNGLIKITQNRETKKISINCSIKTKELKLIWVYNKDDIVSINKIDLLINLIIQIVKFNSNYIYKLNINYKKFIDDYNVILFKYNDLIKKNTDIFKEIEDNNDVGKLKEINQIIYYKELLVIKDNIIIE